MRILDTQEIGRALARGAREYAKACDAEYARVTREAAEKIRRDSADRPVVLLSGPSGSGKTTTANMIEEVLDAAGIETHTISMDNYYYGIPEDELPRDEDGQVDLESPKLLDSELLREQLRAIARGEKVELPLYDFTVRERKKETVPLHRKKGELIVLEGIHALDPCVTGEASAFAQSIYIAPRARVKWSGGLLTPSRVRLMRRMLRDRRSRARSCEDTARQLRSVTRGEDLYIMPNKNRAEISIDSSVPYETALYSALLLDELKKDEGGWIEELGLGELIGCLEETGGIAPEDVAADSLVREFIGGGTRG